MHPSEEGDPAGRRADAEGLQHSVGLREEPGGREPAPPGPGRGPGEGEAWGQEQPGGPRGAAGAGGRLGAEMPGREVK